MEIVDSTQSGHLGLEYSKQQQLTFWSTTAGFFLENIDVMFVSLTLSSMIAAFHISNFAGGLVATIYTFGSLLGGLVFGMVADRIGRAKVFVWTLFIVAFATVGMFFANNIETVYLFRFIVGIGIGAEYGTGVALVAESFSGKEMGRLMALIQVGCEAGSATAALIAAVIIPVLGWHAVFLFGLLPVVFAFLIRIHLRDSSSFAEQKQRRAERKESASERLPIIAVFKTPQLALQTVGLSLMMMVQAGGYYGLMNWLPKILQKKLGISTSSSLLWMIATLFGISVGMYVFGILFDKLGARKSFGIYLLVGAASVYALLFARDGLTLLLTLVFVGFFTSGTYGGFGVVTSRLYGTEARATANSVVSSVGKVLGGFFPTIIGLMMDKTSLSVVMMFFSGIYLFSFVVMLLMPAFKNQKLQTK
ncbi:MFS transporter [Fructobacillus ficulneus]|uniref:Permease n=1 Tax=Fructobacillus ficulneus TaxID=157463 RepID=A0A0K8MFW2_9LACO|nr:MFS transporter [Fructobacillus ficulneus]GAO99377.1 permease [Fructobacillus ficulneus]